MNERIRELAEEAGAETFSRPPMRAVTGLAFTDENLEKFAELIIKECAGICMIEYDTGLEPAPQAPQIARQIKDHFGVE